MDHRGKLPLTLTHKNLEDMMSRMHRILVLGPSTASMAVGIAIEVMADIEYARLEGARVAER
jgi:hypothetical protein